MKADSKEAYLPLKQQPQGALLGGGGVPSGVRIFGFQLGSRGNALLVLAAGNLSCSIAFAYLQERVFLVDGTNHLFVSFLTALFFGLCGLAECVLSNDLARRASLREYLQLSVLTMGGMYFTNFSLEYLNYPTRVMFKSSKVIPVMLVGALLQGKRYTSVEYAGALVLVLGITIFTLGDAKESPKFNLLGVLLVSIGVLFDAVTCNYEEKVFFHLRKASQGEVMMYASLFGSVWAFLALVQSGELMACIAHARENPEVVTWTGAFSVLGYCSSIFILVLIKHFGATEAEIVKSCRKVFTILLSFVLVAKPVSVMHVVGGCVFMLSIAISIWLAGNKKSSAHAAA